MLLKNHLFMEDSTGRAQNFSCLGKQAGVGGHATVQSAPIVHHTHVVLTVLLTGVCLGEEN